MRTLIRAATPAELAEIETAWGEHIRGSLLAWCVEAMAPMGFAPAAHHRMLIRELEKVARGETKRLAIFMPPGSAKSTYASKLFPAWFLAQRPNLSLIGASHTSGLAEEFSRDVQRFIREHSAALGYGLETEPADMWKTTNGGRYKAIGVGGAIAGSRADLAIIDDPVKTRQDADSATYRERAWNWFTADLRTRLKPGAPIILIQTRWHEDDLGGRILQAQRDDWKVISLPATAVENDPIGRPPGEMLWQDDEYGYGAEIARVKAEYEQSGAMRDWYSLYEQNPRPTEGSLFKVAQIEVIDVAPAVSRVVRAWDLAATKQVGTRDPDWTVGLKMGRLPDGRFLIMDVVRLREGPDGVERAIVNTATQDGRTATVSLPQDPGQAGKAQAQHLTRKLSGYSVVVTPETGDKATRAAPVASQINVGNVLMLRAPWNRPFLDELAGFPSATKDDQVDALSRAFGMIGDGALDVISRFKAMGHG
jgi:predicted phage terminase large subunit-like protein